MIERLNAALEGRYRIERELGQGGMATVFLADDVRHQRKVAIKVLRPELAAVIGAERFLAEIRTTANLQHPHILPLHDSGEADGFLFYVMPWVEGESLRQRIERERQLPVDEAVGISRKVADALQYAHEQGVVHRDVKPANILLSRGNPLVADFGIALAVTEAGAGRITETGLSLGTPHYMSPEQAAGERSLDPRSDVYSLGCVLYEMLTGEPPYGGPTSQSVLAKILTEEPRRVRGLRRTVPPHVEATVAKALEKLPADRFPTAEAFAEALDDPGFRHDTGPVPAGAGRGAAPAAGMGDGDSAALGGAAAGGLRSASLSPSLPVLALVAVALLLAGATLGGRLARSEEPLGGPTYRFFVPVPELSDPGGKRSAISPDGRHIAYLGQGEGGRRLFVRRADEIAGRPLPGTDGAQFPFFSPDGEWIGFHAEGALRRIPVEGGPVLTVARTAGAGGHWGDDGTIVFETAGGIYRVPAVGGEPELLLPADSAALRWPELLPGGEALIFTHHRGADDAELRVLGLATGAQRTLAYPASQGHFVAPGYLLYGHFESQSLLAVPFDPRTLEVTGNPVPVLEGVGVYSGSALQFSVSGNGTAVYTSGSSDWVLALVRTDGSSETIPLPPGDYDFPRFSPDGGRISYQSESHIWVFDQELGTNTRLTFEGANTYPFWSADGRHIVFSSSREGTRSDDGFRVPVDGSGPAERLFTVEGGNYPQALTSDGGLLLYRDNHSERGRDLHVMRLGEDASESSTPYLIGDWNEVQPALSPDDRWLAYVSDEGGIPQVFVREFPTPAGRWQVSDGWGDEPTWSPDGRTLYYRTPEGLVAAEVRSDSTFAVLGRRSVLPEERFHDQPFFAQYDVHPDGETFVFVQAADRDALEANGFTVSVNWIRELEERMGGGGGR